MRRWCSIWSRRPARWSRRSRPATTADLREELGDLLLQVVFHAEIACRGRRRVRSSRRLPAGSRTSSSPGTRTSSPPTRFPKTCTSPGSSARSTEKGRTSVLQGIPEQLSALARANKIISRASSRRVDLPLSTGITDGEPVGTEEIGDRLLALVVSAQARASMPSRPRGRQYAGWRPRSAAPRGRKRPRQVSGSSGTREVAPRKRANNRGPRPFEPGPAPRRA